MGNEMGNNNTSELREEGNMSTETEGKDARELLHSNGLIQENNVVPTPENRDYYDEVTQLASDSGDDSKAAARTNGKEHEEPEIHLSVASPVSEQKITENKFKDIEFQTIAALAEELEDCNNPKSSNSKDSALETSRNQILNESSYKKEEEVIGNTSSIAHDPESDDSAEIDEPKEPEVCQCEQENVTNSPKGAQDMSSTSDISEPNIAFNSKGKSHESDNHIFYNLEEGVVPKLQEDLRLREKQFEVEVGNEDGKSDVMEAEIENKTDGEKISNETNSLESQAEADMDLSIPEDKCIVQTEETELIPKESESGGSKHDDNESHSEAENSKRADCHYNGKEDPITNGHHASGNGVLQAERVEENTESCNQNMDSEEHCRGSESKCMMYESLEAKPLISDDEEKGEDSWDFKPVSREGEILLVPEPAELTAKLKITNGTKSLEKSKDFKSMEEEPEKQMTLGIEEKTEAPVLAQVYKQCFPASLLQLEDQQQKTAAKCDDSEVCDGSTSEVKLESVSELLKTVVLPFHATSTFMETSGPAVELPSEKHEEAEAILPHALEATEMLPENNSSASEDYSTESCNGLVPENQQQKTLTKCEDGQVHDDLMSEVKLKSSSKLFEAVASLFHASSTSVETSVPAIVLPIEEAEAVLVHATEIPEILTETNYSASENHPTKVCSGLIPENSIHEMSFQGILTETNSPASENHSKKVCNCLIPENSIHKKSIEKTLVLQYSVGVMETETDVKLSGSHESDEQSEKNEASIPAAAGVSNEEQESPATFSLESIPDGFDARAEMRKSPSFGIDLRIKARTQESDQTPLLYQNNNTNIQDDASLQSSLLPVEYNRESLKYQPFAPEEKIVTLERRDSEKKSKSPFVAAAKQQDKQDSAKKDKSQSSPEVRPNPSKSREKHKRRSSLFTNCMCCTTVLN